MNPGQHKPSIDSSKIVVVSHKGEYLRISLAEIVYIEARGKSCILFLNGKPGGILLSNSIGRLAQMLPHRMFCQIHRSFIFGLRYFEKMNRERTRIYFQNNKTLPITQAFLARLMNRLEVLG